MRTQDEYSLICPCGRELVVPVAQARIEPSVTCPNCGRQGRVDQRALTIEAES